MLSKKEPELEDTEKFSGYTYCKKKKKKIEKALFWENINAGQPFAKQIRCVVYGSIQPSQQKSVIKMRSSRKDLWKTLVWWL